MTSPTVDQPVVHRRYAPGPVLLLLALLVVLLPAWVRQGAAYWAVEVVPNAAAGEPVEQRILQWHEIRSALASPWLPVAAGLLLSVRAGLVDLSVWALAAMGAVVAWGLLSAGVPLSLAALGALATGGVLGLAQGLLAARFRWPTVLVTLGGAIVLTLLARGLAAWWGLEPLSWEPFGWFGGSMGQRFLSASLYAAVMLFWVSRSRKAQQEHLPPLPVPAHRQGLRTLPASGMLAAGGGLVLLANQSAYAGSAGPVGDLRPLVAVLLAGGLTLRGRNGTLLAGLLLPLAMMVTTMWWLMVWHGPSLLHPDYPGSIVALMAMVAGLTWLHQRARRGRLRLPGATWLAGAGIVVMATAAWLADGPAEGVRWAGAGLWLAGLALGLVPRRDAPVAA